MATVNVPQIVWTSLFSTSAELVLGPSVYWYRVVHVVFWSIPPPKPILYNVIQYMGTSIRIIIFKFEGFFNENLSIEIVIKADC